MFVLRVQQYADTDNILLGPKSIINIVSEIAIYSHCVFSLVELLAGLFVQVRLETLLYSKKSKTKTKV